MTRNDKDNNHSYQSRRAFSSEEKKVVARPHSSLWNFANLCFESTPEISSAKKVSNMLVGGGLATPFDYQS